jgi:hypothetical protein
VKSKRFLKFCEKFEGFWFEFERKSLNWKRKRKKERTTLPFGPAAEQPTFPSPAAAHALPSLSLFFSLSDTPAPPVSPSSSPSFLSSLLCFDQAERRHNLRRA